LDREKFGRLEEHFRAFIEPLLDGNDPEDISFSWEFEKFLHSKKLKILTAEKEGVKKWKQALLSR